MTGVGATLVTLREFERQWNDVDALRWLAARSLGVDPHLVASSSRETTTHYKWLLATDPFRRARVWLHEFKPGGERRKGYAMSIHNHRYTFNATVLVGGYANTRFRVDFDHVSLALHDCCMATSDAVPADATYSMDPSEYHRIDDIEDGTQSIVLELAPTSIASFSIDEHDARMLRHVPIEVRAQNLLELSGRMARRTNDGSEHVRPR
jgi:hypothetical protein